MGAAVNQGLKLVEWVMLGDAGRAHIAMSAVS